MRRDRKVGIYPMALPSRSSHRDAAMKTTKKIVIPLAALGFAFFANISQAASIAFTRVTSNSSVDISEDIFLTVTDGGSQQVLFSFSKGSLFDGFITQIYFQDSVSLLSSMSFLAGLSSANVVYDSPATPSHPPGVNTFNTAFSLKPRNPQPTNGISAGETGVFVGTLASNKSYSQFEESVENGSFNVALHAQGLAGGQSDTCASVHAPEPTASLLGGISLIILLTRRVRAQTMAGG